MFSGGDSSESLNQLGAYGFVNQVAVSNAMAAGRNIDWAQLAQQWIQMRDNATSETRTTSDMNETKIVDQTCVELKFEEKGEADMDMDDEEQQSEEKVIQKSENNFSSASGIHQNNMNQPWFFGEGTSSHLDSQSTTGTQWSTWNNRDILDQQSSINSNINNPSMNPTAHIPSLLKMNVPHPNEIIMHDTPHQPEDPTNMMDSAKRKVLPAWIREGLEKMEREKQRQLEKEKEKQNKTANKWSDDDSEKTKDILGKSHDFVQEEEGENLCEESSDNETSVQNIETNSKSDTKHIDDNNICSVFVGKTYEQKLDDLMIVVRRTLTELLLEATNEEISKVAEDTVKLFKSKASSAQVIQKSALSTITGKLGLAAYADSSCEETSDDEGQDSSKKETYQSESDIDSEEELRNTIRTKRRAFIKIADEIEERVSTAAAREEEKLKYFSRKEEEQERENIRKKQEQFIINEPTSSGYSGNNNKGYEKDFGEITETKIQNLNGKRQRDRNSRKERTTRFSDNKDKYVALPATASFITNINVTAATGSGGGSATTAVPSTNQRQTIPDINGLLPSYTSTGMKNVLNAADAALEKVLKRKTSESPKKQSKRRDRSHDYTPTKKRQRHSSSSKHSRSHSKSNSSTSASSSSTSTSSSDSDSSSSSRSSNHSKYNHRSSIKHKSHSSSRKNYNKSHKKDHKDQRNYSSSSHTKKDRGSASSSHYSRKASSDSDEEYSRRRRHNSHYSHVSSHSRSYTSSRHDREHSRSLSRSSYSSSSNRRQ